MKNTMKVALGSTLALTLVFVTSCGQPPKADSNSVLSGARNNFATYFAGNFSKDMHFTESGQSKGTFTANITSENEKLNAKINGTFDGSQEAVQSGTGTALNSQVGLSVSANVDSNSFKGEGKIDAELRVLGEKLYAVINDVTFKSADAAVQAQFDNQIKQMVSLYSKKWFFLDLAAAGGKSQVKVDAAAYAKIAEQVKSKEIFDIVSELPSEDGMYVYRVKPNKDATKALITTIATVLETPNMPTEEDMNKLVDDLSADNITHKLYISSNQEYKKLVTTGTITEGSDTADINSTLNSKKSGDLEWTLTNTTKTTGGAEDSVTLHLEKTGDKYAVKVDAKMGSTKSTIAVDGNGDFTKKDTKVEIPADAQDIMALAAALYGASSGAGASSTATTPAE